MSFSPSGRFRIGLLLFFLTFLAFSQVTHHPFVIFDDDLYITDNPRVKAGLTKEGAAWAFATNHGSQWLPLAWLSHMLDVELFGLNPYGHHFTSLLIHAISAVLLFLLLSETTGALWESAFVAAVFSLHPLRVESGLGGVAKGCPVRLFLDGNNLCIRPVHEEGIASLVSPHVALLHPCSFVQADGGYPSLRAPAARFLAAETFRSRTRGYHRDLPFLPSGRDNPGTRHPCGKNPFFHAGVCNPNHAAAHNNLGFLYFRQGRTGDAIPHFQKALDINPEIARAHVNLGAALGKSGNIDNAILHFREGLRLKPDDPDAHFNLGLSYGIKGDPEAAIFHFREVIRLTPGNQAAESQLQQLLSAKKP